MYENEFLEKRNNLKKEQNELTNKYIDENWDAINKLKKANKKENNAFMSEIIALFEKTVPVIFEEKTKLYVACDYALFSLLDGNYEKTIELTDKLEAIPEWNEYENIFKASLHSAASAAYYKTENFSKALEYVKSGINLLTKEPSEFPESVRDEMRLGYLYFQAGEIYESLGLFAEAQKNYSNAEKMFEEHCMNEQLIDVRIIMGNLHRDNEEFVNAEDCYKKALEHAEYMGKGLPEKFKKYEVMALQSIGCLKQKTEDFKNAEKYLLEALKKQEEVGDVPVNKDKTLFSICNSLCEIYIEIDNKSKAKEMLNKLSKFSDNTIDNKESIESHYSNLFGVIKNKPEAKGKNDMTDFINDEHKLSINEIDK